MRVLVGRKSSHGGQTQADAHALRVERPVLYGEQVFGLLAEVFVDAGCAQLVIALNACKGGFYLHALDRSEQLFERIAFEYGLPIDFGIDLGERGGEVENAIANLLVEVPVEDEKRFSLRLAVEDEFAIGAVGIFVHESLAVVVETEVRRCEAR